MKCRKLGSLATFAVCLVTMAVALAACQASQNKPAPTRNVTENELNKQLLETMLENQWYVSLPEPLNTDLQNCMVDQVSTEIAWKGEQAKAEWLNKVQIRHAEYVDRLARGQTGPFDRVCPEVIQRLEPYLPN